MEDGYQVRGHFVVDGAAFSLVLVWPGVSCFVAGVDDRCDVLGLNRSFRLENLLPRRLPSRIPAGQGSLFRVPSWRRIALAFALVGAPLWHLVHAPGPSFRVSTLAAAPVVCARLLSGPFAVAHRARPVAAPQRVRPCLFSAASRLRAWPGLASRVQTPWA